MENNNQTKNIKQTETDTDKTALSSCTILPKSMNGENVAFSVWGDCLGLVQLSMELLLLELQLGFYSLLEVVYGFSNPV